MPHVSVTRLHLASLFSFPRFFFYATRVNRQVRGSRGFLVGWVSTDAEWGFWTCTVWESSQAMHAFRNSGVHMKVMPKLLDWCDEASYAHWEQADAVPPTPEVAYTRLAREGQASKVHAPSVSQQAGERVGRGWPRPGQALRPTT